MQQSSEKIVTAGMLAIGDELLSGKTKDRNIGFLADFLTVHAIDLKEVRIVGDEESSIAEALNALRKNYDMVFTSGGIGPTHDDITAEAVAKAFEIEIDYHPDALAILVEHYSDINLELTTARKRMARTPVGATLIANPVSKAPGFKIDNVYVLAGVPSVFQAMLGELSPTLEGGQKILSASVQCEFGEGTIGDRLATIQKNNPETSIGSYPRFDGKRFSTEIIVRGRNEEAITNAVCQIENYLLELKSN